MRAVILGAGIAGVCAAAALNQAGLDVVVLDRDRLDDDLSPRPGSPHGRQLHNLLGRGLLHLEELFPGFLDQLVERGGARADVATETHVFELGIRMPERSCGLTLASAPKPIIEATARVGLSADVELRGGVRALGLVLNAGAVQAVDTDQGAVPADMVIDAMGAGAPTESWLRQTGQGPPTTSFEARQWYSTIAVRRPRHRVGCPDFWLSFPTSSNTRGGLISPLGSDRWYVSMSGTRDDPVPRDWPDFLSFAGSLEDPAIVTELVGARPDSMLSTFGRPRATWHRYEQLDKPVSGLLPIGDAVAALNPLLGQGISVAAWQASLLRTVLRAGGSIDDVTRRYLTEAAAAAGTAWSMTRIFDPDESVPLPWLTGADWSRIARAVGNNAEVHRRYVRVWHLLEPVTALVDIARGCLEATA